LNSDATTVAIDGVRLEYRRVGTASRDAPTIVFLHEGLGSITQWKDFPAALCERTGCRGLVYNRQGYGRSDAFDTLSARFMHHEALDVLPRVLDALEIRQPVLFGHSDGGSIALIYAGAATPSPAALVLEAPHVFVEDVTVARIAAARDGYRSSGLRRRLERHHGANVDRLFDGWAAAWLSGDFRGWNIEASLPGVACPTLVVQGADDEYGTSRQIDAIAGAVSGPVKTMIVHGCGHAPHLEQKDTVMDAAVAFLLEIGIAR
jgi:pimeloyl-ACP methyl ester carboxylesterase